MADLKILFRHLALFVNRPHSMTVLLPTGEDKNNPHSVTVACGVGTLPELDELSVMLFKNGAPLREPVSRAASTALVDFKDVAPGSRFSEHGAPSRRWELGGGSLTALPAKLDRAFPGAAGPWLFKVGPPRLLTNRVLFSLELDPAAVYEFRDSSGRRLALIDSEAGAALSVSNVDDDQDDEIDAFETRGELTEFRMFGGFIDPTPENPFLVNPPKTLRMEFSEKPLCPSAQCDGPDL